MSKKPPKINPTGTKYRNVKMYKQLDAAAPSERTKLLDARSIHTKEFETMLKVVGEYTKADFIVRCWEEPVGRMNADLLNPLFPEETAQ